MFLHTVYKVYFLHHVCSMFSLLTLNVKCDKVGEENRVDIQPFVTFQKLIYPQ